MSFEADNPNDWPTDFCGMCRFWRDMNEHPNGLKTGNEARDGTKGFCCRRSPSSVSPYAGEMYLFASIIAQAQETLAGLEKQDLLTAAQLNAMADPGTYVGHMWPVTDISDWCGEFEPRHEGRRT